MAKAKEKTKYTGVRFVEHSTRKHGVRFDRAFYIRYMLNGKEKEECAGWASAGMTAEKASLLRAELMQAHNLATGEAKSLGERRERAEQEKQIEENKYTLQKAWDTYIETYPDKKSLRSEKYILKHFSHLLDKKIEELTTADIEKVKKSLFKKDRAPQTVRNALELIRRLVNFAHKKGYAEKPSRLFFEMPKVDNVKTEWLTKEQEKKLFEALDEEEDQSLAALLKFALFTGMRRSALLALEWNDIDFMNNVITLRGIHAKSGKTEKLPLNSLAREVLIKLKNEISVDSPIIFCNMKGEKRSDLKFFYKRIKEKAELPADFRMLHGLRHSFASNLASSGEVDLYTLQTLLTHSSLQMTQRYSHLSDKRLLDASNVLSKIYKDEKEEK